MPHENYSIQVINNQVILEHPQIIQIDFERNLFAMIIQLGSPYFFVTFTTCVNDWPIIVKTLKELHIENVQNVIQENKDLPNIKDLIKMTLSLVCIIMNRG